MPTDAARDNQGFIAALGPEGLVAQLSLERFVVALGVEDIDAPGYDDGDVSDATASNPHHTHSLNVDAPDAEGFAAAFGSEDFAAALAL